MVESEDGCVLTLSQGCGGSLKNAQTGALNPLTSVLWRTVVGCAHRRGQNHYTISAIQLGSCNKAN